MIKFYEFNKGYEYYALIGVDAECKEPMQIAINAYQEEIADLDEDEKESTPDDVTEEYSLEKYKHGEIEECNTEAAKIIDFYERIEFDELSEQDYVILLMDSNLC
jgi:hypothetical protein